jgi:hypothetical protein
MFVKHVLPALLGIGLGALAAWLAWQGIDASGWTPTP